MLLNAQIALKIYQKALAVGARGEIPDPMGELTTLPRPHAGE
jgi:hypothetical protein